MLVFTLIKLTNADCTVSVFIKSKCTMGRYLMYISYIGTGFRYGVHIFLNFCLTVYQCIHLSVCTVCIL